MRSSWKLAVVAVGLLAAPQIAAANDVEDQLRQMQERMSQLEEKLEATNDQLEDSQRKVEEQQTVIQRAGLEREAESGMASFFEQVEFGGWIAASYWYNFNGISGSNNYPIQGAGPGTPGSYIGGGVNTGTFGLAYPFHPDAQTFQLDQLWFEMSKAATEESRGGFGADILMGKTADRLVGSTPQSLAALGGASTNIGTNGNGVAVYQAYAEYLAPLGPGVRVTAGRFATAIGAEVAQTVYNFNITRGLVYSVLQPVNHVGLKAAMEWDNGFSAMVGATNTALSNTNTDFDDSKTLIWSVGYSQDAWGISFNGLYGGDTTGFGPKCSGGASTGGVCRNNDQLGIADMVVTWDPSENLSTWLDVTYQWSSNSKTLGSDPWGVGLAAAGRLAITEATGFALRFEYLYTNDNLLGIPGNLNPTAAALGLSGADPQLFGITGTVDHALTENLTVKAEARYDTGTINKSINDNVFFYSGAPSFSTTDQVTVGAEMSYRF